ncbi:hypothetical protein [uncultured Roseibium sp.]|uniref:hypothetical protein n=1 Tax=uncultured Roseibium sp. TaxID=1936171 RepID=UPI00261D0F46|nr:hypothetical protein [uncultured Roseibium sp.]
MSNRNTWFLSLLSAIVAAMIFATSVGAESRVSPEDIEAVTGGAADRYSLVAVDDDILRVDRQNGTVSVCKEQSASWRCNPVPLAEDAYLAEINDLAEEVDRLTARLQELEDGAGDGAIVPPGKAPEKADPETGSENETSRLNEKDEKELEQMMTFTESAMRRFFGMVRELQRDFEGEGN